jgi:AraC-like DNA-binding protein
MNFRQFPGMTNVIADCPQAVMAQAAFPASEVRRGPAFVSIVEEFCKANLAQPICVEDLARFAGMNRTHFSRMFKGARGLSPKRYLTALRLEKALQLVSGGDIRVKQVAPLCGFSDPNYFCKVFRRNFGVSPSSYRARCVTAAAPNAALPDWSGSPMLVSAKPSVEIR